MGQFRKAHCNHDLSVLIISGKPLQDELSEAWNEILFELGSLIHTDEGDHICELMVQINKLRYHVTYVEYALQVLRVRHNQNIIDELISMGYAGDYGEPDSDQRRRQIQRIVSLCKTKVYDLDIALDEYNRLQQVNSGQKQSEEDFLKNIVMLKKWGYKIDMEQTMMDEYAQAMNLYMKETRLENQKQGI